MFTLPFDVLLICTAACPMVGWVSPKQYRAKMLGAFTAIALAVTGFALYGLYLEVAGNSAVYLPSNSLISAILRVDMLSIFMASIFLGLGLGVTVYSHSFREN